MPLLKIKRTSEWLNIARDIGVYLDGEKIGVIGHGQTQEFEIEPGEHDLRTKIDWCGSKTLRFEVGENENQHIELSGFKYGKWLMPIVFILSVALYFYGHQFDFAKIITFGIVVPFLLYLVYLFTFGRNRYLQLREV